MVIRDTQLWLRQPGVELQNLPLHRTSCMLLSRATSGVICLPSAPVVTLHGCLQGALSLGVDERTLRLDEGDYLTAMPGRALRSESATSNPVRSFMLLFRIGLVEEICASAGTEMRGDCVSTLVEQIVDADRVVSSALAYIIEQVDAGLADDVWSEEQYLFVLQRLLRRQLSRLRKLNGVRSLRRRPRSELLRRLNRARDYILSCYEQPLALADIASQAYMSEFHFARMFRLVEGMPTYEFLQQRRARCAARLLATTTLPLDEVARLSGFNNRITLFRACKRFFNLNPTEIRAKPSRRLPGGVTDSHLSSRIRTTCTAQHA